MRKLWIVILSVLMLGSVSALSGVELQDMDNNLQAYLPLNESDMPILDYKNQFNLQQNGTGLESKAFVSIAGIYGDAVGFDSDSTAFWDNITDHSSIFSGNFTISYWVRLNDTDALFFQMGDENAPSKGILCAIDSSKLICAYNSVAGSNTYNANNDFPTDTWQHIAIVFNTTPTGNQNLFIYLNGTLNTDFAISEQADNQVVVNSPFNLGIGTLFFGDDFFHVGLFDIDEFMIFSDRLSDDQIEFLYNSGAPTSEQTPPFYSCTPDWSCIGYGSCEVTDTAPCDNVTDLNACGDNYTGNYSEFTPQSCDYCSPSITESQSEDTCLSSFKYENVSLTLTNYEVCCNMTHLASDCVCINESTPLNDSQWYSEDFAMCDQDFSADNINNYSWYYVPGCVFEPEYTTDDITVSIIDSLGRFVVTIALMMGIVAMSVFAYYGFRMFKLK